MAVTDGSIDSAPRRRLRIFVIGLSVAVVIALALLQIISLASRHRETVNATRSHAADLSLILAEHMNNAIAAVDASLKQLVLHNNRVGGPTAASESWLPFLGAAMAGMSHVGSLTVTDVDGVIRHSTVAILTGQSRRENSLFARLSKEPNAGLLADTPFRSLVNNQILIPFGRALTGAGGSFQGIVVATVTIEAFRDFYRSVDVGAGGMIWVLHSTGLLFLQEPAVTDPSGRQADVPTALGTALERGNSGVFQGVLEPGRDDYVNAWHGLSGPPIVLAVSFNVPEALRTWRREAMLSIGLTILVALALGVASLQLVRQLDARAVAESSLIQRDQELVEAQRVAGLGAGRFILPNLAARTSPQLASLLELPPCSDEMPFETLTDRLVEPDRMRLRESLASCVTPGDRYQLELRMKLADGGERILWSEGVVQSSVNSDEGSILAIFQDVTEQRIAEERSSQAQRLAAIGRLTGGVAHDFNNLLTAILGYSEILQTRLADNRPLNDFITEIIKAGRRAAGLTNQLLAFSRKQVLQPKIISLNRAVTDIEKLLRRLIGEDIELSTNLSPNLGRVRADPGQIEQVLMNLAVNARDAMPKGGKLVIETANVALDEDYARLHSTLVQAGPHVMLAVSDTGIGMDKQVLSHIFEPFFTTKSLGKGTGLGLATAYGIVRQSGGSIWAYSEPGKGTTFKVYLPRVEDQADAVEASVPVAQSPGGSETILLVEDEEAVRKLARKILELHGYQVLDAGSAIEALVRHSQQAARVSLMITDVVMPGMGGPELAQRLSDQGHDFKVLYVSGYTDEAIVHHGVLDAKIPFLQKPFTPDALARKVREVLDEPG